MSTFRRVVDIVSPPRLGREFRLQLSASWLSAISGGMVLAAGPLLVASQTSDARLISLAALLDWLPGTVLRLYAGVLADRHDRRLMMVISGIPRVIALAILVAMLATGNVAIWAVLLVMVTMGVGDTFYNAAATTVVPMVVAKADLGVANARLQFGWMAIENLIAPPVGAALFGIARFWPFSIDLVIGALCLLIVARLRLPAHGTARHERSHLLVDLREGLRWSWRLPAVRVLNVQILTFNFAYGAVFATMVLYAHERLGLGSLGYGFLVASTAVGGVVGALTYGWLERHVRIADIMRYGLVLEVSTYGVLAWTSHWWVAMLILGLFGIHIGYWGATASSVMQRAVPHELYGRVQSVYMTLLMGGLVVGAAIGGQLSHHWGITAPYWFGFVCAALVLVVLWRGIGRLAHDDELSRAG